MAEPARSLLEHLRAELHSPGLDYAEPLTPIAGGYDTRIFAFRLTGASEPFSIPLILRILSNQYPSARALTERATQNTVARLGYPAPRVLLASSDPTILGGAFLIMERLAGRPLLNVKWLGIASVSSCSSGFTHSTPRSCSRLSTAKVRHRAGSAHRRSAVRRSRSRATSHVSSAGSIAAPSAGWRRPWHGCPTIGRRTSEGE